MRFRNGRPVYKSLEELHLPDEYLDGNLWKSGIDEGVQNLVRSLVSISVDTNASCEGHLDGRRHCHPWVNSNPFSYLKLHALRILVEKYNKRYEIKWELSKTGGWLSPLTYQRLCHSCYKDYEEGITEEKLKQLQVSAEDLAQFIFRHRRDKEIRELVSAYGF